MTTRESTTTALQSSIEHWQRLQAIAHDTEYDDGWKQLSLINEGWGPHQCALCDLFFHQDCAGCPVSEHTEGITHCMGTPYIYAAAAIRDFTHGDTSEKHQKRLHRAIDAEVEFLQSLQSLLPDD